MRLLAAATALVAALLGGATSARALDVGANDDSARYQDDRGAAMFAQMRELGLTRVVIGVRHTPSDPLAIPGREGLAEAVEAASAAGLRVVLAVYPYPPRELEAGVGSPVRFAAFVAEVARTFPAVRAFVIGNEPNQPAFWRPQFDASGRNVSAAAFGAYLAAAYDALEAVDPSITVIGVGLSPRGNDKPSARNNVSTSPIRFLRSLGAWYRASGRTRPLMDAFSFHPYPREATDPLDRGYGWPNAGFVNLDRVKQALWDAFHGTPQPTTLNGLAIHLDEVGWQVDTALREGYRGDENVRVTDEASQAEIYGELVRRAACDPDVASLSFFGFRDDGLRTGFQTGLQRVDGSPRPASAAVRQALSEVAGGCPSPAARWRPARTVLDASVAVEARGARLLTRISTGEDARATVCVRSIRTGRITTCRTVSVVGLRPALVALPARRALRSRLEVAVDLEAEANAARRSRQVLRAYPEARS
ncbi:MAG: hypothetical protein KatS3mg012_1239 [Gaiellaceae bacterium]|jgi:hypothetical protein|nr:MAG: hypothetical protein KatS3mg012_1239 [Gaiellaceae bacterium]